MKYLAQVNLNTLESSVPGFKFAGKKITDIISEFVPYIFTAAGFLLLIYLIYGGLQLMTSRGDPKAVGEAKGKITNALVGFLIVFISYWVVRGIGIIFGLQGIRSIFG